MKNKMNLSLRWASIFSENMKPNVDVNYAKKTFQKEKQIIFNENLVHIKDANQFEESRSFDL